MTNRFSARGGLRRHMASWLLALGVIGALTATATPAHAATSVSGCFQRPITDKFEYLVRLDLKAWSPYTQVVEVVSSWSMRLSNATVQTYINENGLQGAPTPTCVTIPVPAKYQSYYTTLVVDFVDQGTLWFKGWSGYWANPGAASPGIGTATVMMTNIASRDGLGIHYTYWW